MAGHPGQMLKWMDLRVSPRSSRTQYTGSEVSPILYTLFDQCDIKNLSDCTEIDGWDSSSSLLNLRQFSYLRMDKYHGCSREPSPWKRFFWAPKTIVKMDVFESFSNIRDRSLSKCQGGG